MRDQKYSIVVMPLLAFWAMLTAIIGGGIFCWVGLDIPPLTYVQRISEVVRAVAKELEH